MKNILGLLLALYVVSTVEVAAQTSTTVTMPPQSLKPYAMMQKLAPLAGKWRMTTSIPGDSGTIWQQVAEETVMLELRHKGMLLAEKPLSISAGSFNMETYLTYDQYRRVYRKVAIDDSWGIMDTYEGKFIGDTLVLTNLASGTSFPVGDNKWRFFKLNIQMPTVAGKRTMLIESSDDGGKNWTPAFQVIYTKI